MFCKKPKISFAKQVLANNKDIYVGSISLGFQLSPGKAFLPSQIIIMIEVTKNMHVYTIKLAKWTIIKLSLGNACSTDLIVLWIE